MYSEHLNSLLADALNSPSDDMPRIALAKHLSTHGDWEGELIQVQCDIARRVAADPFRNEWQAVDHVQRLLLDKLSILQKGFLQLYPGLAFSFRRGMLEVVTADLPTLLDHGDECLAFVVFPFVNRLHLTGDTARIEEFSKFPLLRRIRHIWFAEALCDDSTIRAFVSSPLITQLMSLSLRFWGECDNKQLLASYGGVVSADGAEALAASDKLGELRELDLTCHDIRAEGAHFLADSPKLTNLHTLNLDLNDIGDHGLNMLSSANGLVRLSSLSVRNNGISLEGVQEFLLSRRVNTLRCLRLSDNSLGVQCGSAFSIATQLNGLEYLYLANCAIGDAGLCEVLDFTGSSQLRVLNVDSNAIGPAFFKLFEVQHSLEHISAANNIIPDGMFRATAATTEGTFGIRSLNLNDNHLGDRFVRAIAECSRLRKLETLLLSGNTVSDEGASCIRQSGLLENLQVISLDESRLSAQERQRLKDRFGDGVTFR